MTLLLISDNVLAPVVEDGPFAGEAVTGYIDLNILLRNIRDAAGCALAWKLGNSNGAEWYAGMAVRLDGPRRQP